MSKISDDIRNKVADLSVSGHYGEWGALNPTQRQDIRKLCDTCDMFEATADRFKSEIETRDANIDALLFTIRVLSNFLSSAEAEAVKKFAARLKERKYETSDWSHGAHPYVVEEDDIDEVLEEMITKGATNQ